MPTATTFVPPGWVMTVGIESLSKLLTPYAEWFARHGRDVVQPRGGQHWRISISEVLYQPPEPLPEALAEALTLVRQEPLRQAQELFLEAVRKGQLHLGPRVEQLCAEEVVLRAFLTDRALFDLTFLRLKTQKPKRFLDYFDLEAAPLHQRVTPELIEAFRKEVSSWWKERKRHPYTRVHRVESEEELSFFIEHGDLRKSQAVVEEGTEKADNIQFFPTRHDVLHFHKANGRLSVHTQYKQDIEKYRELIGRVFFGNPEQYQECTLYTGAPLFREGKKALSPEGATNLRSVALKELAMSSRQAGDRKAIYRDADLGPDLDRYLAQAADNAMDKVDQITLSLKFEGARHELSVVLEPPNKLTFDRRARLKDVLGWLKVRGFMVPPAPTGRSTP